MTGQYVRRWWMNRLLDRGRDLDSLEVQEPRARRYLEALSRVHRRLRREAEAERVIAPRDLRRRTFARMQVAPGESPGRDAGVYRRRHLPWWRKPRLQAALAACCAILFPALYAVVAFSPMRPASTRASDWPAVTTSAPAPSAPLLLAEEDLHFVDLMSPDGTFSSLWPSPIQYDLEALSPGARHMTEYFVSQFGFQSDRAETAPRPDPRGDF